MQQMFINVITCVSDQIEQLAIVREKGGEVVVAEEHHQLAVRKLTAKKKKFSTNNITIRNGHSLEPI